MRTANNSKETGLVEKACVQRMKMCGTGKMHQSADFSKDGLIRRRQTMFGSRKKLQEQFAEILRLNEALDKTKEELFNARIQAKGLARKLKAAEEENQALNISLDATAAALEQTRGALAASETQRKKLLNERRKTKS